MRKSFILLIFISCVLSGAFIFPLSPKIVEIKKTGNKYQLYRNNEPYFIKGAGGYTHLKDLKNYGGNSVRIWGYKHAQYILDEAHQNGLTVMLGLDMGRERLGFNYDDEVAVEKQKNKIKEEVLKYKDHPALLIWAIGNEVAYMAKNDKVWKAINDIAAMIKKIDPNHPTTTTLAGAPKDQIKNIMYKCPSIDIISINAFQDLPYVPNKIREAGWRGPYIITEWGSTGYWEVKTTTWNAVIEENSSHKAEVCKQRYEASIKADTEKCLGSYIFYWGTKQERTHTFFGVISEKGEKTAVADAMHYLWTNKLPDNQSPEIMKIYIGNKKAEDNIFVSPSSSHTAGIEAKDPDKDKLYYKWELYHESTEYHKTGGDFEIKPDQITGLIKNDAEQNISFKAPAKKGPYRLFVYVMDGKNNVGTANIPFYVK